MTEIVRASLGLPTLQAGPQFQNSKPAYDLEERTFQFAKAVRPLKLLGFSLRHCRKQLRISRMANS